MDTEQKTAALPKSTPKDIFLHLLNIVAFYTAAISYISLLIQYVNILLPDRLNYYFSGILNSIFWATSMLVVSYPTYLLTSWLLEREFAREPAKRELKVRKWLVYATLFVAAVTILGDIVALVYNFLRGELTLRFFCKMFIVMAVSSASFGYYYWGVKRNEFKGFWRPKTIAWLASGIILVSVIFEFFLVGSPATQRERRFDEQRTNDLNTIQNQAINYWVQKAALPQNIQQLETSQIGFRLPIDPETDQPYEYRPIGTTSFELCATFGTSSDMNQLSISPKYAVPVPAGGYYDPAGQSWEHKAERTCFSRTIDPEIYRPQKDTSEKPRYVPAIPPPR